MLILVAVVVEILIAEIMEVIIADYFNWRSEIFLESFLIYGSNLKDLFNPKYRSTTFNI
jgi:hypothetical protein